MGSASQPIDLTSSPKSASGPKSASVMASSIDQSAAGKPAVLKRLFETGEWSDLSIITATKTFPVHKNIVCTAADFFHAACTRGFKETHTNQITVPEDEHTMDAILRTFYEQPVEWLIQDRETIRKQDSATRKVWLTRIVALRKATDKYGLEEITKLLRSVFHTQLDTTTPLNDTIEIGARLFDEDMPIDDTMRRRVGALISLSVEDIHKDRKLWDMVSESKDYTDLVFGSAMTALRVAKRRSDSTTPLRYVRSNVPEVPKMATMAAVDDFFASTSFANSQSYLGPGRAAAKAPPVAHSRPATASSVMPPPKRLKLANPSTRRVPAGKATEEASSSGAGFTAQDARDLGLELSRPQ